MPITEHKFAGFETGCSQVSVPAPLLAELLEQMDDLDELKLVLRGVWLASAAPDGAFSSDQLYSDRTVSSMLGAWGAKLESTVGALLDKAVKRGVFKLFNLGGKTFFRLNYNDRWAGALDTERPTAETLGALFSERNATLFEAYEKHIGPVTPMAGEKLESYVTLYGEQAVIEAIGLAASKHSRSLHTVKLLAHKLSRVRGA